MAQVFPPIANTITKASIIGVIVLVSAACLYGYGYVRSSYMTSREGIALDQPVPFSHEHHVNGVGLDCRYCHTSVEQSSIAGIPPTETCMNCHTQIWNDSPMLAPVRQSYEEREPLVWNRVHDVPDFVYFNHSIHVNKGIGCTTCHGQVDQMPLMWKNESLLMQWCLQCHRDPAQHLRPLDEVFNMDYEKPKNQRELGRKLMDLYDIRRQGLTDCYTCHR